MGPPAACDIDVLLPDRGGDSGGGWARSSARSTSTHLERGNSAAWSLTRGALQEAAQYFVNSLQTW